MDSRKDQHTETDNPHTKLISNGERIPFMSAYILPVASAFLRTACVPRSSGLCTAEDLAVPRIFDVDKCSKWANQQKDTGVYLQS